MLQQHQDFNSVAAGLGFRFSHQSKELSARF